MALVEVIAVAIGPSIAKGLVSNLIRDHDLAKEILNSFVDLITQEVKADNERTKVQQQVMAVGEQIAKEMEPLFRKEGSQLGTDEYRTVVREVSLTLAASNISTELLVSFNLDARKLATYLLGLRKSEVRLLSDSEASFYQRMLTAVSTPIADLATTLSGFYKNAWADTLTAQDAILDTLTRLSTASNEQATEFERQYRKEISTRLDKMELFGVPDVDTLQSDYSLSLAYITLRADEFSRHSKAGRNQKQDFTISPRYSDDIATTDSTLRTSSIEAILKGTRRLVVSGDAGFGKTTLLKWMAVRAANRYFPQDLEHLNNLVPFFIRLRECVEGGFPPPERYPGLVARHVAEVTPSGWVHSLLATGRALVLVDGVDELPEDKRHMMLEELKTLVKLYPLPIYVVTSRPYAVKAESWPEWQQWLDLQDFDRASLQRMDPQQIDTFVTFWHNALISVTTDLAKVEELKPLAGSLKAQLRNRLPLRRLATSPLLCAMLCALHRVRNRNLPTDRTKLYRQCCEMLLSDRDEVGKVPSLMTDYPHLSEAQKFNILQRIAYWLMESDASDMAVSKVDQLIQGMLSLMGLADEGMDIEKIRRYFVERASILRYPVEGRVDFTHRTFQEYLAAEEVVLYTPVQTLLKNAGDDLWRETIIVAAGLTKPQECEDLIIGLIRLGNSEQERKRQLHLLALACLETSSLRLPTKSRSFVLEHAAPLFPPQDTDEARLVAAAGDPAIPLLRAQTEYSVNTAIACIRALTLIGTEKALEALGSYANFDQTEVLKELSRSWYQFDEAEYATRVLSKSERVILSSLSSFKGLEHISNVKQLDIVSASYPPDLRPLEVLTNVRSLHIYHDTADTPGETYAAMSDPQKPGQLPFLLPALPALEGLTLAGHGFRDVLDISAIRVFSRLRELALITFQRLSDFQPLMAFPLLEVLHIANNDVLTHLDSLPALPALISLHLQSCYELYNLADISKFQNLTSLRLDTTGVTNLSPLSALSKLTNLTLEQFGPSPHELLTRAMLRGSPHGLSRTIDLAPVARIANLRQLTLNNVTVTNLRPLRSKPYLEIEMSRSVWVNDPV